eukprot:9970076-Alexandrium_andersonii.AAC.1
MSVGRRGVPQGMGWGVPQKPAVAPTPSRSLWAGTLQHPPGSPRCAALGSGAKPAVAPTPSRSLWAGTLQQ